MDSCFCTTANVCLPLIRCRTVYTKTKNSMPKSFVLNDESAVNSYGFVVLNAGIDTKRFLANPVMLHEHRPELLNGRWENLRTDGTRLMADPVFDIEDPDAKKIEGKVERGFLKGASVWIRPIEAELRAMPDGELIPFVTKSELMEASTTSVPSNSLALRLSADKLLTAKDEIKLAIDQITINKPSTMEKIILSADAAKALAVNTELSPADLNAAVLKLAADKKTADDKVQELTQQKEAAESKLSAQVDAQATALVETAITEGRLTADKKETFLKMAKTDFAQAKAVIEAIPPKATLSGQMKPAGTTGGEDRSAWDYMKWAKEDPKGLAKLSAEKPEEFAALKAAYKPKH